MDSDQIEINKKISAIFMPHATERTNELIKNGAKFVHYTSAENGLKIITSKTFWLRDARCMNDYSEIHHGYEQLRGFFSNKEKREPFISAVNECFPGLAEKAFSKFDQWWVHIPHTTYIGCFSEHDDREDDYGRLSMWRAYGQSSGVGLILNLPVGKVNAALRSFITPVKYFEASEVEDEINSVAENIRNNRQLLSSLPEDTVSSMLFMALVMGSISIKHPAFREEREWRVVHLPMVYKSDFVRSSIETIHGTPQVIYKIPLENNDEHGVQGVGIKDLACRVIIGPSAYPGPIANAYSAALVDAGVDDAWRRVIVSNIPLRV